jgi:hypothetical protein
MGAPDALAEIYELKVDEEKYRSKDDVTVNGVEVAQSRSKQTDRLLF